MTAVDDPATADAQPQGARTPGTIQMFVNDIPFGFEVLENEIDMVGDVTITDALRYPGSRLPRASVLATIADCMVGIPACLTTAPKLAVTLDISVHSTAESCGDRLG